MKESDEKWPIGQNEGTKQKKMRNREKLYMLNGRTRVQKQDIDWRNYAFTIVHEETR